MTFTFYVHVGGNVCILRHDTLEKEIVSLSNVTSPWYDTSDTCIKNSTEDCVASVKNYI
jgi:hypothetical protein